MPAAHIHSKQTYTTKDRWRLPETWSAARGMKTDPETKTTTIRCTMPADVCQVDQHPDMSILHRPRDGTLPLQAICGQLSKLRDLSAGGTRYKARNTRPRDSWRPAAPEGTSPRCRMTQHGTPLHHRHGSTEIAYTGTEMCNRLVKQISLVSQRLQPCKNRISRGEYAHLLKPEPVCSIVAILRGS